MKKLSVEQLNEIRKEKANSSYNISVDFANDWYLSSSSYICDSISEFADGQVDIYYSDRAKWFAENWDKVDQANAELGSSGSIMQDIAQAQYLENSNQLYEDIENIAYMLIIDYLLNIGKSLTSEQIEELAEYVDHNERWDDIADKVDELLQESEA